MMASESSKYHHYYYYSPHILILAVVVCGVILNYMSSSAVTQPPPASPSPPGSILLPESTNTMAATEGKEDGDVKEVLGVKIYKNPSQSKLHDLGISTWPTWEGSPGQIPWTFTTKETMYILEGRVKVCCQEVVAEEGQDDCFEIVGGDLVEFPKGMKITWKVIDAVKKHYHLGD
ncbi:OLC1v1018537C1 [Oldenlandia corymbosa var. corymbosa]|uniref:OLC1v1018537C1 n=1 Tax=Oldenlandia corymbosa var. corymbosa TaxID=529605 RepID=A0AAV1EC09_OLDCO|nr:OLC1v1018537C1 [Oldenlandia corymbosa var. corymbosa]